ncbi:transmembrane protein 214-B [Aplysia californica]|uniref:Transmembrane protein 214-B n=1 Tax=Aplysia californica TaxID=6500 RepID=A0ABM1VU68_APLCA|nr:transmembrane protein 214-B [Aplysia californica]
MASAAQWEVVGKSKKTKGSSQSLSKSQKKTFVERMPRIETNAPVKEDRTIYTAFLEKEQKDRGNAASARASNGPSTIKKPVVQKKKKPEQDGKKNEKPVSLETAISQIDHHELENILSQSQMRFPDNQDVWLKDLASFLNLKLEKVKNIDPTFKGMPQGYPLELLSQSCQKVLHMAVKKFSNQTLDHLFYHTIQTMLVEASKDQSILGYKIFLQLLAHHKPDIALGKIHQYLELLKTHQNRPANCLSVLWAVGQCGVKNFKCGLKVWLDLMLPALEVRQVAHYPVEFLEQLIGTHKKVSNAYGIVTLREYFQVMDVVFSPAFNLSNDLRKRLVALYPNIRELAYGDTPSHNLRTFFPSYLARLNTATNQAVKNELLMCLVKCLTTDQQSYSVWCQLYTKHLTASGLLLEYINNNWSKLSSQFDKKLLRETVRSFSVTNEEMETQGCGSRDGLSLCQAATKELVVKMTRTSFPWGLLVFFLVSVVASIVVYDIMSSPNLRSSRTMRFLEHYGVLALAEQAWGRIHTFITLAINWLKVNCPVYYAYLCETVGPFLALCWVTVKDFVVEAELASRPHRAWAGQKAWDFYLWVYALSPETWVWCEEMLWLSWEVLKDYSFWIWKHSLHMAADAHHWLTEHVFTGALSKESVQAALMWSLSEAQSYMSTLWAWCDKNVLYVVK